MLDGHSSRNNAEMKRKIKEANIDVVIFPPHMTHIMKPFDRVIAIPLKDCLNRIDREIINDFDSDDQTTVPTLRLVQVMSLIDHHRVATTSNNCNVAFTECGLYPYNPDRVLSNKQIRRSLKKIHSNRGYSRTFVQYFQ